MLIIITGETCPTCKMAKQMLQKKDMEYREVSADTDEGKRLLKHHKASSLPLIIEDNSGIHHIHYDGASVDNNAHISAYHTGEFSHWGYSWSDKDQSYVYDTCFDNTKFPVKIIGFYDVKMDE